MDHENEHEHDPAAEQPAAPSTEPAPTETASPASPSAAPAPTSASVAAPLDVPPHTHEPEGRGWALWVMLAALLFFIGYSIAFIVGNDKAISVDFVFATGRVSLIWTILLVLLIGLVAGALFSHLYRRNRRKKARKA